jgi:hypothetical protein
MRHVQIFKHLLRNPLKHRGGDLSTLVKPNGRIENNGYDDGRVVNWCEAGK